MTASTKPRHVLITGATRGLGRAMASEFIRLGHRVVGCGRTSSLVEELRKSFPSPHRFDVVDVANDDAVASWAADVLASEEPPDLLLNNAAVINDNAPLWEVTAKDFSEVIDVNVKGVANVLRHFVPSMARRQSGVIVNFSSGWGRSTSPEVATYCATKWAVEGLTQAMAQELPSGMAAIPLNPGIIDTDLLRRCFGNSASSFPDAEEWAAKAVPFLLKLGPQHSGKPLTCP